MFGARLGRRSFLTPAATAVTLLVLAADAPSSEEKPVPDSAWRQTETSLGLLYHGRVLWQHHHDPAQGKPFMDLHLPDGTPLTRPWPIPEHYPARDHTWHKALWWSWKWIDGVNYWEGNQEGTKVVEVKVTPGEDFSARMELTLHYCPPENPPILSEKRILTVSAPGADGQYHVDWQATFATAGQQPVVLGKNSYGGMAIRLAAQLRGSPDAPGWKFLDNEGRDKPNGRASRWVDFSGPSAGGSTAGIAVFVGPHNPNFPPSWRVEPRYPYFNPSFTGKQEYQLAPGKQIALRYRILVHPQSMDREGLEHQWKDFAESKPPAAQD